MDSAGFDHLARSLVTPASRRRILAGALSAALGLRIPPAGGSSVRGVGAILTPGLHLRDSREFGGPRYGR